MGFASALKFAVCQASADSQCRRSARKARASPSSKHSSLATQTAELTSQHICCKEISSQSLNPMHRPCTRNLGTQQES